MLCSLLLTLHWRRLKKNIFIGGRLCSFSPCMEQTQRTCEVLNAPGSGFYDVETVELVQRPYNVKRIFVPVADIGLGNSDFKKRLVCDDEPSNLLPCAYETGDSLPLGEMVVRTTPDPGVRDNSEKNAKRQKTDQFASHGVHRGKTPPAATKYAFACRTCVSSKEIYGHTGYLTFASYCPDVCLQDET